MILFKNFTQSDLLEIGKNIFIGVSENSSDFYEEVKKNLILYPLKLENNKIGHTHAIAINQDWGVGSIFLNKKNEQHTWFNFFKKNNFMIHSFNETSKPQIRIYNELYKNYNNINTLPFGKGTINTQLDVYRTPIYITNPGFVKLYPILDPRNIFIENQASIITKYVYGYGNVILNNEEMYIYNPQYGLVKQKNYIGYTDYMLKSNNFSYNLTGLINKMLGWKYELEDVIDKLTLSQKIIFKNKLIETIQIKPHNGNILYETLLLEILNKKN